MRYIYQNHFQDRSGNVVEDGNVTVYNANTTNLATIYSSSGSSVVTGSVVTTGADGFFKFWVDANDYTAGSKFKIILSKTDFNSKTYDDISILPDTYAYYANPSATDQGVDSNDDSIKDLANAIGSTNYRKIILRPGTYTVSTDMTVTPNIILEAEPGVTISLGAGKTLTANLQAGWYPIFSGTGSFVHNGGEPIKVNWWVTSGSGTAADPWLINNFEKPIIAASSSYSTVLWASGDYKITSNTQVDTATRAFNHYKCVGDFACRIRSDNALATFFSFANDTGYSHELTFEGFHLDGQGTGGTTALMLIKHSYLVNIKNCNIDNGAGVGLKIHAASTDNTPMATAIEMENLQIRANDSHGIYIVQDSGASGGPAHFRIHGNGTVESNGGYGIALENVSHGQLTSLRFESNTSGNILLDNCNNIDVFANGGYPVATGHGVVVTNGSYGNKIFGNGMWGNWTSKDAYYAITFDETTYENYYWGNNFYRGTAHSDMDTGSGNTTEVYSSMAYVKVLDEGSNYNLDFNSTTVTTPENSGMYHNNKTTALTGETYYGNQLLKNWIADSDDFSVWTAQGAGVVLTADTNLVLPVGYTGSATKLETADRVNEWIYLDTAVNLKAGETMTFSLFAKAFTESANTAAMEMYIGSASGTNGKDPATGTDFRKVITDSKFIDATTVGTNNQPMMRHSLTWTAQANHTNVRVRVRPMYNSGAGGYVTIWGAQLNKGKIAPHIHTDGTARTVYPGIKTHRIMASGGSNLGFINIGNAASNTTLYYYKGKYQKIAITESLTLTLDTTNANEGEEIVVDYTITAAKVLTWGANMKFAGGSGLTTAGQRHTMSFYFDGTDWVETGRIANIS